MQRHHSKILKESNANYGNNLIIWDLVFGTFFWPKQRQVGAIGLIIPDYPEGYLAQLSAPFQGDLDKPHDFYIQPEKYEKVI